MILLFKNAANVNFAGSLVETFVRKYLDLTELCMGAEERRRLRKTAVDNNLSRVFCQRTC